LKERILVIHTAFIGDVILLTSLIREIKKVFPDSMIDTLVVPGAAGILNNNPNIDNILVFDKKKNKLKAFIKTLSLIKKNKYTKAFLPHSSLTTTMLAYLGQVPEITGFDRNFGSRFLTKKTPFRKNVLRLEKNLDLLRLHTDKILSIETELFSSSKEKNKIDSFGITDSNKQIAIAPGSVWFTKKWIEDYYKELSAMLHDKGYKLIYIGGPEECEICNRIAPSSNFINLAGKTSILESAEAIRRCKLMICNDSGTLHLANSVDTDVAAIFGPTDKSLGYFPYKEHDIVIEEQNLDCRPCGNHGHKECPEGHFKCMKNLTPEYVLEVITKKYLNSEKQK